MKKVNIYSMPDEGLITREELVRLFVTAKKRNKTPDDLADIAHDLGYKSRTQIQRKDIPEIEKRLMSD